MPIRRDQADALIRQALRLGDTDRMSFADQVAYLRQAGGSGRGAARMIGVSESSLRRWAAGTRPKAATMDRVAAAVREHRTKPAREDRAVTLSVVSYERKRGRRPARNIGGGQLQLQPGTMERTRAAWVQTGDTAAAAAAFVGGVGEPWYRANFAHAIGLDHDIGGAELEDTGDYYMTF